MTSTVEQIPAHVAPRLSRGMVLLFAFSCGATVANLYYAQPILNALARSFGTGSGAAGLVVTFAQIGYALGLAFLVPLGDLVARRLLVPVVLLVSAVGLLASAVAPTIGALTALGLLVGGGSVAAQLLVPMAASLASDEERGHVVGSVMSGLLLGILLARTVSGIVAQFLGWRAVFIMAAALSTVLALVLRRRLPPEEERPRATYRQLLAGVATMMVSEPRLRQRSLYGALAFGAFSVFWTTMAFLLAGAPYHYGAMEIGLFGLVGAGGALVANLAGRLVDRGRSRMTTLIFAALIPVSFVLLWWGANSLAMLIAGILALDAGVQGLHVTNQSLIYRLAPHARSRVTSGYMVSCFVGGAVGSALGSEAFTLDRWAGVCVLGVIVGVGAAVGAGVNFRTRTRVV